MEDELMLKIHERDLDILARTIYGEARGELNNPEGGMQSLQAVGWVIKNRAKMLQFSPYIHKVCMQPWQFSCWNLNDPNRKSLLETSFEDKVYRACFLAATRVLFDNTIDCTKGANHYHSTNIAPPYWAVSKNPTVTIGHHIFYKL
jgi:spore germination cell wall hydrolase CwlJ-like protein